MSKIQMLLLVLGCCVFTAGCLATVSNLNSSMGPAVLVTGNMLIALSRLCKKSKDDSEVEIMEGLEVYSF
eukprot:Skav203299  [mRNA]  locus=scaffold2189:106222:106431:+ [translate_table: standard]